MPLVFTLGGAFLGQYTDEVATVIMQDDYADVYDVLIPRWRAPIRKITLPEVRSFRLLRTTRRLMPRQRPA